MAQGFVAIFFACLLGFLKRRKVIACPAGICWVQPQYNAFSRLFFRLTESVVYRLPKRVVFFSEEEKKQFLTKMGFLPRNYSVIPTGVKIKKTRVADGEKLRAELGLRRKKVVLFAGRLLEVKGVEYLIKAMKGIKATLVVVGDGPLRKELEMLSGKEGVDALFVGWRSDVERFLSIADVFVLPSLSEGLPLVLLEAMAAGKPCIVTDIGLPVTKNFDALAVPPKNAAALREALRRLLNNKTLAKKLGENARKTAEKFSWERAASQYVELAAK